LTSAGCTPDASHLEAVAELDRANLNYASLVNGVNTSVANY